MLREFLDTKASVAKIAECMSLCGPSIERVTKEGKETVYHVEVTTNRVDAASSYGLAREASAILPEFKIPAKLKTIPQAKVSSKTAFPVEIVIDKTVCERFMAIKLENVDLAASPDFMQSQLNAIGQRPINNAIDITNYAMFMTGTPMHAFDYDKLVTQKIVVRIAKKGESFTTLDNNTHAAHGNEIVFDDGNGTIIDIPGVMGCANTAVSATTKTILLVSEHMDPLKIRETSLKHEIRTYAANLNEKNLDPHMMESGLLYAVGLFEKHAKATIGSTLFDWYPNPEDKKIITVTKDAIDAILGIQISDTEMIRILETLGFSLKQKGNTFTITVPTFRNNDVEIPEDIAEEIARVYGYFRFPNELMEGRLTKESQNPQFAFENQIKTLLSGWGGVEVYTESLVGKDMVNENALRLKNPLGGDREYLRTDLVSSLFDAARVNKHEKRPFHLFELAHVYLPQPKKLPKEEMRLAGIFVNTDYRHAKGVLEALFEVLHITKIQPVLQKKKNYFFYEFTIEELYKNYSPHAVFTEIPIVPPQIEDITVILPEDMKVGAVIETIKESSPVIRSVELTVIFEDAYTFRITYLDPEKTLTDKDVEIIRDGVHARLQKLPVTIK